MAFQGDATQIVLDFSFTSTMGPGCNESIIRAFAACRLAEPVVVDNRKRPTLVERRYRRNGIDGLSSGRGASVVD
jgi:hypothetical protein